MQNAAKKGLPFRGGSLPKITSKIKQNPQHEPPDLQHDQKLRL